MKDKDEKSNDSNEMKWITIILELLMKIET